MRQVLARLAHEGVVTVQRNRGAFVAEPSIGQARDLFEARRLIEPPLLLKLAAAIDARKRTFKLANKTGGLSGPAIKPIALLAVYRVAQTVKVPIIGMGGIMNATDAVEFLLAGATAVAAGTVNFVNPLAAIEIADGIADYLEKNGFTDVHQIIGAVE